MTASQAGLTLGVTRCSLNIPDGTLSILKGAVEAACNVPAARAAYETRGRKAAMEKLTGERKRVVEGDTERGKVLVERAVNLSPRSRVAGAVVKKKRVQRSGRPTGWPKNQDERDAWELRRAERAARGEPVGRAALFAAREKKKAAAAAAAATAAATAGADGDFAAYVPTAQQHAAFTELVSRVAQRAGVDPAKLTAPVCRVSMSAPTPANESKPWWRPVSKGGGALLHMFLSVEANTPARLFWSVNEGDDDAPSWGALDAGDFLAVPANLALWECPGQGDFVLEIGMSILK